MVKVRILITGKVQGVFFRQSARQQAKTLKIGGWVKNLPDGSVLSEAVGPENSILEYIAWCKKGPQRAHVSNTVVKWLENTEDDTLTPLPGEFDITD